MKFVPAALLEWQDLDGSVKEVFRKLLRKRLDTPRIPGAELRGDLKDCYKIKLLRQGYRLIYLVEDIEMVVLVLAVAKRENSEAYRKASRRKL